MFLSYAVVPVFTFTLLLNFFYLYSPIDSKETVNDFPDCQQCLKSDCHIKANRTCTMSKDNSTFQCYTCDIDASGKEQYYEKECCDSVCTGDGMECLCEGACYLCLNTSTIDKSKYVCEFPTIAVDENCEQMPFNITALGQGNTTSEQGNTTSI